MKRAYFIGGPDDLTIRALNRVEREIRVFVPPRGERTNPDSLEEIEETRYRLRYREGDIYIYIWEGLIR